MQAHHQRVSLRTADRIFGDAPTEFALWKYGGPSIAVEGDPDYQVGERYMLFVEPRVDGKGRQEPNTFVSVSPDGRLKIDKGTVRPTIAGALADRVSGRPANDIKGAARAAKERSR